MHIPGGLRDINTDESWPPARDDRSGVCSGLFHKAGDDHASLRRPGWRPEDVDLSPVATKKAAQPSASLPRLNPDHDSW
jgi:hypothetical protein